ncbi:MAG: DUF6659 family protein [Candidatus Nitrosotenuis sp.]
MLMEKSNESWHFEQKCRALLEFPEIKFAGVINKMGKLVAGGFKKDMTPPDDPAERQKMYMELVLRVSMRKEFDYSLGPVKYSASRREKAVMMSFPIGSNVLLISANTDVDLDKTAKKIMKHAGLN